MTYLILLQICLTIGAPTWTIWVCGIGASLKAIEALIKAFGGNE